MKLNLRGFGQLVEDMSAALQSSATALVDVSVGSVVRAIFEANASVVLWLQWLILQVLQMTRASTSVGGDLDTWMLDFGLARLPAVASTGIVTFSRFVPTLAATIPVGSIVKTADGSLSFAVAEDRSISIWESSSSAYVIPSGVAAVDVPVVCTTSGLTGNVLSRAINIIAASLPGVDQVNNSNPLSTGADAETDAAFRNRFQLYLASRSRATFAAVENAIANVRQGLDVYIGENTGGAGQAQLGALLIVIDDGTGYPSSDLLSDIATAVDAVRPVGTTFSVVPPQVQTVGVSLVAEFAPNEDAASGATSIQNRVSTYLNSLGISKAASITRIAQSAYMAGANVENISSIQLDGGSVDIIPPPLTVIKAGQVQVIGHDR